MADRFVFGSTGRKKGRRRLFLVTLIVAALFAFDVFSGGMIRSYVRGAAAHFWVSGSAGTHAVKTTGFFATHSMLAHENDSLRSELVQYQSDSAANAALRDENAQLRTLVNLAASQPGTAAAVVSSFIASPYGTFLISAHAPDVARGDLVLSAGGFVIGRVTDVSNTTSLVTEIFASDASIEGLVAGNDATINGYGGGNARAALARDVKVAAGDMVVAAALGQRPIGIVGSVESSASSADQTVYIRLPVNLSSLRYVYVVPAQQ